MKYKFLFLLFIALVNVSLVQAVGFSPSSLTFDLEKNQEECKMVTIDSESETINVSDSWAENKDIEWKVSSFNTTADEHEITINYDDELSLDEREVKICLYGNKIGEYHGVLLFKEEQQGNSIVQFGVWLKVLINEKPAVSSDSGSSGGSSGGGGGGGGSSGGIVAAKNPANATNQSQANFESLGLDAEEGASDEANEETQEDYISGITGGAIWGNISPRNLAISGLVILALVGLVIYNKRQEKLRREGKII